MHGMASGYSPLYQLDSRQRLSAFPPSEQDCEDESEGDGRKRERSLLLLAGLASDALDAVSGMKKVRRCVIVLFWSFVALADRLWKPISLRPVSACLLVV